jgi:ABC-2 type transport system permease protein
MMHRLPSIAQVLTALVFLALAVLILYSIWILVVCTAFWVVKVDNLSYLFGSLFDVGRWPIDVLRGVWRGTLLMVFTVVFPVALMTTYPALALLGRLGLKTAVLALAGGIAFAVVARRVWQRALGMYTSASS